MCVCNRLGEERLCVRPRTLSLSLSLFSFVFHRNAFRVELSRFLKRKKKERTVGVPNRADLGDDFFIGEPDRFGGSR